MAVVGFGLLATRTLDRASRAVPSGSTVVVLDGQEYSAEDFSRYLGRQPRFLIAAHAETALRDYVEYLLVLRERGRLIGQSAKPLTYEGTLDQLAARLAPSQAVGADQVRKHYDANRSEYVHPRLVRVAYFHVAPSGDVAEDLRRARSFHLRLRLASDQRSVVRLLDREPGAEGTQGALAAVPCDRETPAGLPSEVVFAACGTAAGTVIDPIQTSEGWFVVRSLEEIPAIHRTVEEVSDDIRAFLENRRRQEARHRALGRLRETARVEIRLDPLAPFIEGAPSRVAAAREDAPVPPGFRNGS